MVGSSSLVGSFQMPVNRALYLSHENELMQRPYDIILFGATGFTGQLVAAALTQHAEQEGCRIALAGRDLQKLEGIRSQLPGNKENIGIIAADIKDKKSLVELAAQGKILISTVGPYNWYGEPVIEACLEAGTHYLDITGEPTFVHNVFTRFHQEAITKNICLINCCGFDSIPADLGAWLTARALPVSEPKAVRAFIRTNAAFSGGTWTTAIHALYRRTRDNQKISSGPRHPDTPAMPLRIHYQKQLRRWAIPMPVVDPHIVKRSARHLPGDYGAAFAYGQFFTRGSLLKVIQVVFPIIMVMVFVRFGPFRKWLFNRFPPGTGPSPEKRSKSRFEVTVIGEVKGQKVMTRISGGDPGYDETAKMLSQSAFTLLAKVRKGIHLPGVRTPVEALGMDLVERLRQQGITINTDIVE